MRVYIAVEVELEKTAGKFAAKDDIENAIMEAIDGANYGSIDIDDSSYDIVDWSCTVDTEQEARDKAAAKKARAARRKSLQKKS